MDKKFLILGVMGVCAVAACLCVIGLRKNDGGGGGEALSSSSKSVTAICSQTDYQEQCKNSVSSVANNESAVPQDFLKAALQFTIHEVESFLRAAPEIGKSANNSFNKMAVEDCQELLQDATEELQASFSTVGDTDLHTMEDREAELKNWLSAVISYQDTCLDGIEQPELKDSMSKGMLNSTQLTDNALAIVSALSKILPAFGIQPNSTAASRRLMAAESNYNNAYPEWMTGADRKLLQANNKNSNLKPNAVVAKDGSGQFKTIAAALAAYPKKPPPGRYVIYVKAGRYNEYIQITKKQTNIFMYGDGPTRTIVSNNKSNKQGVPTFRTATFAAMGKGFIAKSMGFENTAGAEGHQAVALRVQSDMSAFYDCHMNGYQDTLYVQTHRQFYSNCQVSGTIDFIFGDASAVIQDSLITVRKPMSNQKNSVTAQGRSNGRETTGLVIQNCKIVAEPQLQASKAQNPSYLGRPWKQFSRTIIMQSDLGDFLHPDGWMPWQGNFALNTLYYAEYANRGPGAITDKRIKWKGYHVIRNVNEVQKFTAGPFLQGQQWLAATGAPHFLGMKK